MRIGRAGPFIASDQICTRTIGGSPERSARSVPKRPPSRTQCNPSVDLPRRGPIPMPGEKTNGRASADGTECTTLRLSLIKIVARIVEAVQRAEWWLLEPDAVPQLRHRVPSALVTQSIVGSIKDEILQAASDTRSAR